MRSRVRRLAIPVVMACLLAGCQPAVLPTPAPAPSYRCTPEAGGDEFDCTQHQYDDMVAKDKLYAEAEAVYRRFLAEDVRISRAGGTDSPSDELLGTASGAFLKDAMEEYKRDREEGITILGGEREVKSVSRLVGVSKGGSVVSLRVCTDASSVKVFKKKKFLGNGLVTEDDLYFSRIDAQLKLVGADGKEVKSCAS